MSFALAGQDGFVYPLTIGGYTNIMNVVLVMLQILVLRRRFEPVQLFQLVIGFLFGALIDLNMVLTSYFDYTHLWQQIVAQLVGCSVMAIGISLEVRCGSVTMPGEGIQVACARVTNIPFPKMKIIIDMVLVVLAILSCYIFWGAWQWNIIGPGTLFAMLYIGLCVKLLNKHLNWFDTLLNYRSGLRRYIFGLARFIFH